MWHIGMVLMASALTRWHAASRVPVSSTPWQIAGAARVLPSPHAYAATVTIPETKNATHFNMRDARYYQIPLSSRPPAVTVNPGETVAVRDTQRDCCQSRPENGTGENRASDDQCQSGIPNAPRRHGHAGRGTVWRQSQCVGGIL